MHYIIPILLLIFIPPVAYAFTYENEDLNIIMEIPDDWGYKEINYMFKPTAVQIFPLSEVSNTDLTGDNMFYDEIIDSSVYLYIGKNIDVPYNNIPLEVYKDHIIKLIKDDNIHTINKTTFKNHDIYNILSTNDNLMKNIGILTISPDAYIISYIGMKEKFVDYYPTIQNITKSLEFIN